MQCFHGKRPGNRSLLLKPGNCSQDIVVQLCKIFFFCERVIAPWNCLHCKINSENLRSIISFKRIIKGSDLSSFLYYS